VEIRVVAAGLNFRDVMNAVALRDDPEPLGGECAGRVVALGDGVEGLALGDHVVALANASMASHATTSARLVRPIPHGIDFAAAVTLPFAFMTALHALHTLGRLSRSQSVLIHAGAGGVGMAAIQIARALRDARVLATAGTEEKCRICLETGAQAAINYRTSDWGAEVRRLTDGRGVDVVLDGQAGPYTERELALLKDDGRVVLLASHLGATAEVNVRDIVRRRLTLTGATLRPRPPSYKGRIAAELVAQVWPLLEDGRIRVHVCATFPLAAVAEAHALMDANEQIGKVVLTVAEDLCRPS
jgi:NADPH:quinone reductase-like Zn-dependent oxidoreductase